MNISFRNMYMGIWKHVNDWWFYFNFQAPSLAVKEMWVKEIKRVLMNQFDEIKGKLAMFSDSSPLQIFLLVKYSKIAWEIIL